MAEKELLWNDGRTISVTYDGDGDGSATFSSNTNEGIDQEREVTFKVNDSVKEVRTIKQEGLREIFNASDGDFVLADGGTFNVLKGEKILPSNLTQVEYIDSNGSNYIDTGIVGRSGLSCEMKMLWLTMPTDTSMLSSRNGTIRFYMLHCYRGWCMGYGNYYSSGATITTNTIYEISTSLHKGSQTIVVNDEQIYSSSYEDDIDTNLTMYVFGMNNNGAFKYAAHARLYELRIFDNGEKIADYTPCVDSDGNYGLYDWVSESFYPLI